MASGQRYLCMPRILLAGIFHETHTFVDERTELKDFTVLRGAELLACKGDGSPLGGLLEAAARYGWEILPTVGMRAQPGGIGSRLQSLSAAEASTARMHPAVARIVARVQEIAAGQSDGRPL